MDKYEFYCKKHKKWVPMGTNGICPYCELETFKKKGMAIEQIREAWKETCEKFGLEYNEDDWDIKFKE